jgi:subtilase family serine protease
MRLLHRPLRAGAIAVLGLAMTAMTGTLATTAAVAAPTAAPSFSALRNSVPHTTDKVTGHYSSSRMSIEVALAPRNKSALNKELKAAYTKNSGAYHHWLAKGTFDARYAPSKAERAAVSAYLRQAGLTVRNSSSSFLVRASGSSKRVSAAFRTTLSTYRNPKGTKYFSNSTAVKLPSSLTGSVLGVIGLSNTIRDRSMVQRAKGAIHPAAAKSRDASVACTQEPYPTTAQFFAAANSGAGIPFGFGNSPGCNGLSPSQDNGIYGAPHVGARGKGSGVNIGVFELSEYQHADIDTWAHQFYGNGYTPPLVDVNVDGGPGSPVCPTGDTCPPSINGFAGDIEVDADIQMQLALSPDVKNLIVYNAPNDFTGQTELDEWTAIANADQAESVSSSWAVCENDESPAYEQAENDVFEQMALQGQSVFGAEGDTGAFSCIRSDGSTIVNVLDPPSQPWVTSVGGTSLESANPGFNPNPSYPTGAETVWNDDNLCSNAPPGPANDNQGGFFWCGFSGAGGGASSEFWGRPFYQVGKGVNNPNTTVGNGGTQCQFASIGTPCREDPDISANADEFTPYGEVCTANANTPNSQCGFSASSNAPGWFGIGGTSLSSPLWSAIIADRDSFQGSRSGNVNPLLYLLFNLAPNLYFHDITGVGQTTNNNGLFPTTPGYDEATGIGTPRMSTLITATF